ncbi:MAG: hypothetical protein ACOC0P_06075, partial [Planctomycetota bacterium]
DQDGTPGELQSLLRQTTDDRPYTTFTVRSRETGMLQDEVEGLQDRLARYQYHPKHQRLRIELKPKAIQPFGLAVILAWAAAHAAEAKWEVANRQAAERLAEIDFAAIVQHPEQHPLTWSEKANLAIVPIPATQAAADFNAESQARLLVQTLTTCSEPLKIDEASRESLVRLIAELSDNVRRHAEPSSTSWLLASRRAGDKPAIRIAVCDLGRGMQASLALSEDAEVAALGKPTEGDDVSATDANQWIRMATDGGVSGQPGDQAMPGFGLYFLRRAASVEHGELLIRSGRSSFRIQSRQKASGGYRVEEFLYARGVEWPGTFIGLQLPFETELLVDKSIDAWTIAHEHRAAKAAEAANAAVTPATVSDPESDTGAAKSSAEVADEKAAMSGEAGDAAAADPVAEASSEAAAEGGTPESPEFAPTPAPAQEPPAESPELPASRDQASDASSSDADEAENEDGDTAAKPAGD